MIDREKLAKLAEGCAELVRAKDGEWTLMLGGNSVHSRYAPMEEAARLIEPLLKLDRDKTLVVILGIGIGYPLEALEENGFHNVIAIERNPEIYRVFKACYRMPEQYFLISPDDPDDRIDSALAGMSFDTIRAVKVISLRGAFRKELYESLENRLERLMKVMLGDFTTRLKFEENWMINILRNTVNLRRSYPVSQLFGRWKHKPAVIVSAGPSLRTVLPQLAEIADKAILIAVDTALVPLYEAGIVPDFVFSLDSQVHNLSDFAMIDPKYLAKTRLVYDAVVHSALPNYFPGVSFISNTAHLEFDFEGKPYYIKNEFMQWMEESGGFSIGDIETGGSVATSAFDLAFLMGADPIILTGQDLAYSFKASHCVSTPHYYRWWRMNKRTRTMEKIGMDTLIARKAEMVDGIAGSVYSDFVLKNFRGWFEETAKNIRAAHPQMGLWNAGADGALIRGFDGGNIGKILENAASVKKSVLDENINLIELKKTDKIFKELKLISEKCRNIDTDERIFAEIEEMGYPFLKRYFLKDRVIFERYGKWNAVQLNRKMRRLLKNAEAAINGFG